MGRAPSHLRDYMCYGTFDPANYTRRRKESGPTRRQSLNVFRYSENEEDEEEEGADHYREPSPIPVQQLQDPLVEGQMQHLNIVVPTAADVSITVNNDDLQNSGRNGRYTAATVSAVDSHCWCLFNKVLSSCILVMRVRRPLCPHPELVNRSTDSLRTKR